MNFSKEFIEQSIFRMEESKARVLQCINELNSEQIWKKENQNSNSIANLTLHLCGNIRQYITSCLGGNPDIRERDLEFNSDQNLTKKELCIKFEEELNSAISVLKSVQENRLTDKFNVQGFHLSGIGIIIHVVEHLSYHTGQIAFYTKTLKNTDLGFYKNFDLNVKNK